MVHARTRGRQWYEGELGGAHAAAHHKRVGISAGTDRKRGALHDTSFWFHQRLHQASAGICEHRDVAHGWHCYFPAANTNAVVFLGRPKSPSSSGCERCSEDPPNGGGNQLCGMW